MSFRIDERARNEIREAANQYRNVNPKLSARFITEVYSAIDRAIRFPKLGRASVGGLRRRRVRDFPYDIVFEMEQGTLVVVAVFHQRRNPDYWLDRSH